MQEIPDNSIDAVITDPPYGLAFMGKEWDHGIPGIHFWQEILRVSKPGAHMLAFGGTRTHHRLMVAIEDAGWEIRDCLMWLYGSGFPKSKNIGNGWGTALKPAWEPIILARKPFPGTVAENVLQWGTGAINVDGCRIGMRTTNESGWSKTGSKSSENIAMSGPNYARDPKDEMGTGRWPANLLLDEEAAAMLDEQSGELISGANPTSRCSTKFQGIFSGFVGQKECAPARGADSGGASRFFYTAKADPTERNKHLGGMPAIITTDGRDKPIDNPFQRGETLRRNHHPTVKPIDLLRYLCKLITPPGGLILDPFAGSGSTGVAAFEEGFDYILIEKEPEYCQLARMRNAQKRIEEFA